MAKAETKSVESILEKYIPQEELKEVKRILFGFNQGELVQEAALEPVAQKLAEAGGFELQAYSIGAKAEHLRKPRVVKIGLIQHACDVDTSAPISEQVSTFFNSQLPSLFNFAFSLLHIFILFLHFEKIDKLQ